MRMATTLSVLVLGAGGIGHAVMTSLDTGIDRVDPFKDMKNRPSAGHGLNLLLVGTDRRDKITEEERQKYRLGGEPCNCTDTVMLVHLSADGDRASVVSVPRDSYAELPEHTDAATGKRHEPHAVKLNAAYAEGGPHLTVSTVERMTGVKISHYLEVDFTSFMKTVDALGGVEICTPRALKDSYTGLDLAPGTHSMNGGQALQYVRSRHIDGAADLGRMQRQQRFLAALIDRATSSGVLLNPVRFKEVSSTMLASVRADAGFGTEQLLALNEAMRGFSPSSSEFTSVPLVGDGVSVKGVGATVKWDPVKSRELFRALREDRPLTSAHGPAAPRPAASPAASEAAAPQSAAAGPEPGRESGSGQESAGQGESAKRGEQARKDASATPAVSAEPVAVRPQDIRVQVYNGTRTEGLGKRIDDALHATGFNTTRTPLNSDGPDLRRTVVMYDPRWDLSAKSLAAALPGSELRAVSQQGATLKVMAGTDFTAVRPVRAQDAPKGRFGATTGDQVVCR
ncbi:LCP family protein [Streptomyces sp. NPDC094034]|uniref:LCP family protein n=1 Tax=Streptomyces sp. NPDC094034 TaxID=3155309 RepID=UPI00333190B8